MRLHDEVETARVEPSPDGEDEWLLVLEGEAFGVELRLRPHVAEAIDNGLVAYREWRARQGARIRDLSSGATG